MLIRNDNIFYSKKGKLHRKETFTRFKICELLNG